jgi:very-short-patch-repair endonuclease
VPALNPEFIRTLTQGDGARADDEIARLAAELGLDVALQDFPDVSDIARRLQARRPHWDWREPLDPENCSGAQSLAELGTPGIYNRAVVIAGARTPYTLGLESELRDLAAAPPDVVAGTALGTWLRGVEDFAVASAPASAASEPLVEVLPMNVEQRAAVEAALTARHTVVTGPPGTGKSQVVTNLLVNAALRGMRVLFASKNNRAVDVVEERVNRIGNRPVLLRLGPEADAARLREYLSNLLATTPDAEAAGEYAEGQARHRALALRLGELDREQQKTMEARNLVDRRDAEAEGARRLFGELVPGIDESAIGSAEGALAELDEARESAVRSAQRLPVRVLWIFFRGSRLSALQACLVRHSASASAFGLALPAVSAESSLDDIASSLEIWRGRVEVARALRGYQTALASFRTCIPLEEIARQRVALAREIAENSLQLWKGWLQVEGLPRSAEARKDVADYVAILQVLAESSGGAANTALRRTATVLQAKVARLFHCWGITSLSVRNRVPFEPGCFDLVVIDEASQCDIASALPLLYRAKRSVVIGDAKQLRHITALGKAKDSELQFRHGLLESRVGWMYSVSSLFDVAIGFASAGQIVNLRDHHRSHADIIEFSNRTFYDGRLRVATRYDRLARPESSDRGILWLDVKGKVHRPPAGGAMNDTEARAVVDRVEDLLVRQGFRGTVGIVTPFRAQAQRLQELLVARDSLHGLAGSVQVIADTVHRFQGDERDVMFFSPVVSAEMPEGGASFLRRNANLFNVAITRARSLLCVVGDRGAIEQSGIDYLMDFSAYVGGLKDRVALPAVSPSQELGPVYPAVARPENVSEWERCLYGALHAAGVRPIPQYSVDAYDLDFAVIVGDRKLDIEVDGERYHRAWTGELVLRDQLRNQRLIELGWDVKRFWVYQLRDDMPGCVAEIVRWVKGSGES